jgi:hypothetical protein
MTAEDEYKVTLAQEQFVKITEKYGMNPKHPREINPIADPQDRIVLQLSWQLMNAHASLTSIAGGSYQSTDTDPVYAGGVVSPGNRIYTPAEGAEHVLKHIDELEKMFDRKGRVVR